jgi:hypothetical protein
LTPEVVVRGRAKQIPEAVRREIERLKALDDGFHYRELARILFMKFGEPIDHKTVKTIWHESPVALQGRLDKPRHNFVYLSADVSRPYRSS